MGTICAPNYANIFMGKFKRNFMYRCLQTFSNFYCQFIDNIFLIWNGSETELLYFITRLNSRHPTIKFDFLIFKIQCRVLRHKNLQKQREEQITNSNIPEINRLEESFGSYLTTPKVID